MPKVGGRPSAAFGEEEGIVSAHSAKARYRHLSEVGVGETVRIAGIEHGHGLRMRLLAMGVTPGVPVRVIQRVPGGPCIVAVRGTRVALGRGRERTSRTGSAAVSATA